MYHWEGISEFVTVAETNSFTAAGKRLGISTAQVSRQINRLEIRLNSHLFYRTTRKVSLTEEGSIFYSHCRQVLNNLEDAERAISSRQENPQGTIRMTAPASYGERHVMPAVLDYMKKYPEIEVICNLTNQTLDLVQEGYDLAIRLGHLPSSSMMARQLSTRIQYVCASGDYIRRNGAPHSLSELSQHNCLVGNSPYWWFMENGKQRSIKVSGNLVCSSGYTLMDAAKRGMGLIQLPGYYVNKAIQSGKLTVLLQSFREPKEGIWAIYPHNRQLSSKIRLLVDWLADALSQRSL